MNTSKPSRIARAPIAIVSAAAFVAVGVGVAGAAGVGDVLEPVVGSSSTGPDQELTLPAPTEVTQAPDIPGPDRSRKASLPRDFFVKTNKKVFFITIDDGITKNADALAFVERRKIPVTVFLTNAAVHGRWSYFRKIAKFGGSVQNHTMTHTSFTSGSVNLHREICRTQKIYAHEFKAAPTLLRPPYGNGGYANTPASLRNRISRTASGCGIKHIVMWDAVASHGNFQFIRHGLTRGDIVLFHFTPNLGGELRSVMAMAHRKGLRPAVLTDYLK